MKNILLFLAMSAPAFAGLPPTTSKLSSDSANVTTFNYQFPNFTGTHTGTTVSLGVLSPAGGGTGTSTVFTQGSVPFAGSSGIFAQDNANFFWDATNHRLGLGTTAPVAKLTSWGPGLGYVNVGELSDNTNYGAINFTSGSLTVANYSLAGTGQSLLINRITGQSISFRENNGSDQLTLLTGGKFGIGISTPASKVHQDSGTATATYSQFTANATTGQTVSDGFLVGIDASGNATLNQQEALPMYLKTNGATAMTILSGGNVGIGTITPQAALDIGVAGGKLIFEGQTGVNLYRNSTHLKTDAILDASSFNASSGGSVIAGASNLVGGAAVGANTPSLTVTPTAATRVAVAFKGAVSQSANITEWEDSTNAVLASVSSNGSIGSGIAAPASRIHQDSGTATATYSQFTANATTGQTATDGLLIGIDASANAVINQQEALPLNINVNGSTRMSVSSAGVVNIANLTASLPVFTDASKNLTSTGTVPVASGGTGQTSYTDGQLLIGNTSGNTLTKATLTAGANVTITNGNGSISIASASATPAAQNYTSQTTTYSAVINDWVLASGSSFTITLPTAASQSGKSITIQHNGTSETNLYTINTTSAQTINGPGGTVASGGYVLHTNGEVLTVTSDGSNWQATQHKTLSAPTAMTVTLASANGGTCTGSPAFGTSTQHSYYWREGSRAHYHVTIQQTVAGTAGSTCLYGLTLPVAVDTTYVVTQSSPVLGTQKYLGEGWGTCCVGGDAGVGQCGHAVFYDSTHFFISFGQNGTSPTWGSSYMSLAGSSNLNVGCDFMTPISGWQP